MERIFIDESRAKALLPERRPDGNKSTFGRVLLLVGSEKYRGAAHLATEAALRGGAGYVTVLSEACVTDGILLKYPEALLVTSPPFSLLSDSDIKSIRERDRTSSVTLIGPGCDTSKALAKLTRVLLSSCGAPLIVDADAINSLAKYEVSPIDNIREAKRPVILTPHPLELSRLTGIALDEILAERERTALRVAASGRCVLLLKGKNTVITDGEQLLINGSGSTALAKAGSGDTLAGLLSSLAASGLSPLRAAAFSAFVHGAAGDALEKSLSPYGVTPSDLPVAMAKVIASLCK